MEEQGELQFSGEALLSRANFFDGLNDINLFVEDADSQYFYETIFKRLLGEKYSIKSIFPCGGKPAVVRAFQERGTITEGRKNVYIVDGDFDRFLFPEQMIEDPQFVYLKMYNIESCIINEAGLCSIVKSNLKCMDAEAHEKLNYTSWWFRIIDEAKDLFFCYCYIQKFGLGIPNVDRGHYKFLDSKTGFKRMDGAFEQFKDMLAAQYSDAEKEIINIQNDFERRFGKHYEMLICGKFLLSSLHSYLRTIIHKNISNDDLKWWLVNTFNPDTLDYVRRACIGCSV